jgi:hypothetical protein
MRARRWVRVARPAPWTCVAVMIAAATPAAAQTATRQVLAPMGGGYGQTVRVTAAAPDGARCALSFGLLLPAQPQPVEARELDLGSGQAGVVDVSVTRLVGRPGRRVELLPWFELRGGQCLLSTEVFEQVTGRTLALSKAVRVGFDPQPDPPAPALEGLLLPAVSVANGQIVRLGVARGFDPQPEPPGTPLGCTLVLAFADARGGLVGHTLPIDLAEGEAATLDLNPALLLPATPGLALRRALVQPRLLLPASGGDASGCVASLQLVDALTGWTTALVAQ